MQFVSLFSSNDFNSEIFIVLGGLLLLIIFLLRSILIISYGVFFLGFSFLPSHAHKYCPELYFPSSGRYHIVHEAEYVTGHVLAHIARKELCESNEPHTFIGVRRYGAHIAASCDSCEGSGGLGENAEREIEY